jgi:hypothetical protein
MLDFGQPSLLCAAVIQDVMHASERLPLPPDTTCPQLHLSIENKPKLLIFRNSRNEKSGPRWVI